KPVHTNFTVSQILYSLSFCDDTVVARHVKERAVAYLLDQREAPGVWRYYDKASGVNISPDLDDTAMAWAALQRAGHSIIPEALDVIRQSRNDAGLFNTWIG